LPSKRAVAAAATRRAIPPRRIVRGAGAWPQARLARKGGETVMAKFDATANRRDLQTIAHQHDSAFLRLYTPSAREFAF
jgi:hypothetical protein